MWMTTQQKTEGFTLVEVLLVVLIMGMLAGVIIPRYELQRRKAAVNATKANLEVLRTAIAVYYETEGSWPAGDLSGLINSPTSVKYLGAIPKEAIRDQSRVVNIADYAGGWVYDLSNHTVLPNLPGTDVNGDPFSSY